MIGILIIVMFWKNVNGKSVGETVEYENTEYEVLRESIRIDYSGDGEVGLSTLNLDFQVSGTVESIMVKEGEWLDIGTSIATLEKKDYETSYEKALNNYEVAQLNLDQIRVQNELDDLSRTNQLKQYLLALEESQKTYERNQQLGSSISAVEIENSKMAYEKALTTYTMQKEYNLLSSKNLKKVELAELTVETGKLDLQEIGEDLLDTELKSPVAGKVLAINFSEGESFSSPDNNNTNTEHFMVLLDSSEVEVIAPISEIDIESVFEEQAVEIVFEAFPSRTFHGVVTRVEDIPTSESGMVTYDAIIQMRDADDAIKDGMTCEIDFILAQRERVLVIPNKAVHYEDGVQFVMIADGLDSGSRQVIKTGLTDGKYVEVVHGLTESDVILYQEVSKE